MIHKDFLRRMIFTFLVSSLQDGLDGFYGNDCVATSWNGIAIPSRYPYLSPETVHSCPTPDLG
jgi:hypothetical protein